MKEYRDNLPLLDRTTLPERLFRPYMEWWHGQRGSPHQHDFYRCAGCRRLLNWKAIRKGGCDCDGSKRLHPARLSTWEMVKIMVFPWSL